MTAAAGDTAASPAPQNGPALLISFTPAEVRSAACGAGGCTLGPGQVKWIDGTQPAAIANSQGSGENVLVISFPRRNRG